MFLLCLYKMQIALSPCVVGCPTASLVKIIIIIIIISYNNVNIVIILLIDLEEDKVFDSFLFLLFIPWQSLLLVYCRLYELCIGNHMILSAISNK